PLVTGVQTCALPILLREELENFEEIEVVGEAANGREALQQIAKLKPELVFLDLQMPVMSGFEVVRGLGGANLPVVVIVTAFDQRSEERRVGNGCLVG